MNTSFFGWTMAAALSIAAVACAGSTGDAGTASNGDNDITGSKCGPATLTCAPGFAITTDGCASSHVAGAPPQGRCVSTEVLALSGSWVESAEGPQLGNYWQYTFASDATYTATGGCRAGIPDAGAAECFAVTHTNGTFTVGKSGPALGAPGGAAELNLVDQFGQKETYYYAVDGKKLSLSTTIGLGASESILIKQ